MPKKNNLQIIVPREQLNAIIALLLVLIGEKGNIELLKKRRANKELVKYFGEQLGLNNKDLAGVLNTTESGISNLKSNKKRKKK
jgi:maltooligosyltrehalose synthase